MDIGSLILTVAEVTGDNLPNVGSSCRELFANPEGKYPLGVEYTPEQLEEAVLYHLSEMIEED